MSDALLVAALRRSYLLREQGGVRSAHELVATDLPAKTDELEGVAWLPRILAKARAKLRGELNPEMMYGCGGDRRFLGGYGISVADFLEFVWHHEDQAVLAFLRAQ